MIYAQVNADQHQCLQDEMRQVQTVKWYQRLKIIDLSGQGFTVTALAHMFDLNAGTIRRYIHAYNEAGLDGLRASYGQGRPLTLDWTAEQWLDLLAQSPADLERLNTGAQNWTQALLREYLAPSVSIMGETATMKV